MVVRTFGPKPCLFATVHALQHAYMHHGVPVNKLYSYTRYAVHISESRV